MSAEEQPRYYDREYVTEGRSFDDLARGLADDTLSRRRALKLFAGALLGGSLLAILPGAAGAEQSIGGGGGGTKHHHHHHRHHGGGSGGRFADCPSRRVCRPSNRCCPRGQVCAPGGGVCCPPERVCTVGGVANACCDLPRTCVNGVCVLP